MIPVSSCAGKKIAVMGLGKSGLATLAALKVGGALPLAWDDGEDARMAAQAAGFALADLSAMQGGDIHALVLSPGIPLTHPAPHPVAARARQQGIEIIGDIELLFREPLAARKIGITGTNGKSTTTALIGHILKSAGKMVETGGNLGTPALALASLPADGFYVLEMSSYQCDLTPSAAFDVAVLLNITPDHLDRHGGMEGYIAAKRKIFRASGRKQHFIVGVDDLHAAALADELERRGGTSLTRIASSRILAGGISAQNGVLYRDSAALFDYSGAEALPGSHNAQNVAAATATCLAMGLSLEAIRTGILSFPGLPHRQQRVRRIGNVSFINDSKATNAAAAAKALGCYSAIYWIAGGKPKEGGLNGLEAFMPAIRHAFLIGEASDAFAAWLNGKAPHTKCGTLARAVEAAATMARHAGEESVVLLSPACASFDQFKNYEQRGEAFAALVNALPSSQ